MNARMKNLVFFGAIVGVGGAIVALVVCGAGGGALVATLLSTIAGALCGYIAAGSKKFPNDYEPE